MQPWDQLLFFYYIYEGKTCHPWTKFRGIFSNKEKEDYIPAYHLRLIEKANS